MLLLVLLYPGVLYIHFVVFCIKLGYHYKCTKVTLPLILKRDFFSKKELNFHLVEFLCQPFPLAAYWNLSVQLILFEQNLVSSNTLWKQCVHGESLSFGLIIPRIVNRWISSIRHIFSRRIWGETGRFFRSILVK